MQYKIISQRSDNLAKLSVVALGFSIPISTTLDNVLLLFIFLLWLLGAEFRSKLTIIKSNPIAILALVIFGLYVLGLFYGDVSIKDAMESLTDAAHFLLIPLLIPLFKENRLQHHALWGFLSAMLLTLAFSYLIWLDLLPQNSIFKGTSVDPVVFKFHITHSIFMAFAAFLFALKARHVTQWPVRLLFATLSALAIHNVLFMVQGKTGHLVLLFLIVYFFINWLRWKGIIVAAAFIVSLSSVLYFTPSSALNLRFTSAVHEFSEWNPEQANQTSVGIRLEFYKNSLQIICKNPLFGVGTGGFSKSYAQQVKGSNMVATVNPHNEYLMVAAQLGLMGITVLLYLFFTQWRLAIKLSDPFEQATARGLVLMILSASMASSTLIDHSEGLFFFWMSALVFAALNTSNEIREHKK